MIERDDIAMLNRVQNAGRLNLAGAPYSSVAIARNLRAQGYVRGKITGLAITQSGLDAIETYEDQLKIK